MSPFMALMIGTAAGVIGTGSGATLAWLIRKKQTGAMGAALNFSSGLMLAVVCFELLPEAFGSAGLITVLAGIAAGVGFVFLVGLISRRLGGSRLSALSLTLSLGIAVHNIPEGLAIGASLAAGLPAGLALTLAIFIHDIPEGVGVGLPIRLEGGSLGKAVGYALLAGLPTGFGALAGAAAGTLSDEMTALCLASAGGAMLYLVLDELLPEAGRLNEKPGFAAVLGVITGVIITNLL